MPDAVACALQNLAHQADDLLIWTICENPSDYPGKFTLRPHSIRRQCPCLLVLVADTLKAAREMLPPDVGFRFDREIADDPVVVESWL